MTTQELLRKVRRIEIKSKGLSEQVFTGEYHSAFKGKGMSFSEVREYQWGDDVRNIDWNVTARYETPYIKVYEEERELTVMLLIDVSPSTIFGTQLSYFQEPQRKDEILAEICAVLAFSAMGNQDNVGAIFFTDKIESIIPPKKGKNHILHIIREIIDIQPKGKGTDILLALRTIENVLKKRSIVFLLSDFWHTGGVYKDELGIVRKKHDVIGLHLYDEREKSLPEGLLFQAEDAETGATFWIDTTAQSVRTAYQKRFDQNKQQHQDNFKAVGADFVSLSTKDSYTKVLRALFEGRR